MACLKNRVMEHFLFMNSNKIILEMQLKIIIMVNGYELNSRI